MTDKNDTTLAIAIVIAGLLIAGAIVVASGGISSSISKIQITAAGSGSGSGSGSGTGSGTGSVAPDEPAAPVELSLNDRAVLGDANAPVLIVEFSDFQCPFCRRFYNDAYAQVKTEYVDTGKAKVVFKHFPLANIHPAAQKSAEAMECALDQGKAWEMHDIMFDKQNELNPSGNTVSYGATELKQWASEIPGIDAQKFDGCLDSGEKAAIVERDFAEGVQAGVSGTPSFLINGKPLVGAQPFSAFKAAIDAELAKNN